MILAVPFALSGCVFPAVPAGVLRVAGLGLTSRLRHRDSAGRHGRYWKKRWERKNAARYRACNYADLISAVNEGGAAVAAESDAVATIVASLCRSC